MNTLQNHHRLALVLVVPLVAGLAVDTAVKATSGQATFITDDTVGSPILGQLVNVLLALALLSLFRVLRREAGTFTSTGRVAHGSRRILLVALPAMAVGLVVVGPVLKALGVDSGPLYDASGLVALLGLLACVLAAMFLGLSQLRHNMLGAGGRLLVLIIPAMLVTGVVAVIVPDLASPVLLTSVMLGGLATLGVGVHAGQGAPVAASPTR